MSRCNFQNRHPQELLCVFWVYNLNAFVDYGVLRLVVEGLVDPERKRLKKLKN